MNKQITIIEAKEMNDSILQAFENLTPQLSTSSALPSQNDLEEIIKSNATRLLFALNDKGIIIGTLTLVIFRIPTGVRAWIEDVVVDNHYRGTGIGKKLCKKAIEIAKQEGSRTIDLTSRPTREVANKLYQSVGFKVRDTNVYRIELK